MKERVSFLINTKLKILICALMAFVLFAGCSGTVNKPENDFASPAEASVLASPLPTDLNSICELHDYLLTARLYANSGYTTNSFHPWGEFNIKNAVYFWNLGDKSYYYVPSWLPKDFTLVNISISSWSVAYTFVSDDFFSAYSWAHENILTNQIVFEWVIEFNYTDEGFRANVVERENLISVYGVDGLYFKDFGADLTVSQMRSYFWLQDGYMFIFSIPLHSFADSLEEISALVLETPLQVELIDGVNFKNPSSLALDIDEADIQIGETITLETEMLPHDATIDAVIWSTSDRSIATVTQDGEVTRVRAGNVTITAKTVANGLTASFTLGNIEEILPTDITLDFSEATVSVGATIELFATVFPNNTTDKTIFWASSDESIAIVNTDGIVTGVGDGTAVITATTVNGLSVSCEIKVLDESEGQPISVAIERENAEPEDWLWPEADLIRLFVQGDFCQLHATVQPMEANQDVAWASSHPEWVLVDDNGFVEIVGNLLEYALDYLNGHAVTITATATGGVSGVMRLLFDTTEEQPIM